jgi:hypothetical protein
LAYFANRALLQTEHLAGSTGQPQPARREGETTSGPGEQLIFKFFAQVANVE